MQTEKQSEPNASLKERPLQYLAPELYDKLKLELDRCNLHPYDVKASGAVVPGGIEVILRYGEGLAYLKRQIFNRDASTGSAEELSAFFRAACDDIQKALVADYFKMMKP